MGEFGDKLEDMKIPRAENVLSDETFYYIYIRCTACPYREFCPNHDPSNGGCGMRKSIFDRLFSPIDFKTDDPIALNRLRLLSHNYVRLMLKIGFGDELTPDENVLLRTVLQELAKLYIDKKGDLLDQKSKTAVPWEQTPELDKLRKEVEEARSLRLEVEELRAKARKRKVDPDGTDK